MASSVSDSLPPPTQMHTTNCNPESTPTPPRLTVPPPPPVPPLTHPRDAATDASGRKTERRVTPERRLTPTGLWRKVSLPASWSRDGTLEDPDSGSTSCTVSTSTSSVSPQSSAIFSTSSRKHSTSSSGVRRSSAPAQSSSMLSLKPRMSLGGSSSRRGSMDLQMERMESSIEEYHRKLIEERKQKRNTAQQLRDTADSLLQTREEVERSVSHAQQLEQELKQMREENENLQRQVARYRDRAALAEMRYKKEREAGSLVYSWYTELVMEVDNLQSQRCPACGHQSEHDDEFFDASSTEPTPQLGRAPEKRKSVTLLAAEQEEKLRSLGGVPVGLAVDGASVFRAQSVGGDLGYSGGPGASSATHAVSLLRSRSSLAGDGRSRRITDQDAAGNGTNGAPGAEMPFRSHRFY